MARRRGRKPNKVPKAGEVTTYHSDGSVTKDRPYNVRTGTRIVNAAEKRRGKNDRSDAITAWREATK